MPVLYILCAVTLAVTLWDRKSFPWALLICSGVAAAWIADQVMGDKSALAYPAISAVVCVVSLGMMLRSFAQWKAAVHALAVMMLLADGWLFGASRLGVYVGQEYATLTSAGLVAQLILIGHQGARHGLGILSRRSFRLRRFSRVVRPTGREMEAP